MSGLLRLYEDWIARLLILASFIVIGAGGLGAATTVGLIGLLLLPLIGFSALRASRSAVEPIIYGLAAVVWASISLVWSPYDRPDQIIKFFVLTPAYGLAVYAMARLDAGRAQDRLAWFSVCAGLLAVYLLFEVVSGAFLSAQFKLAFEPVKNPDEVAILADRILGRGTFAYLLVAGPVVLALWVFGGRLAKVVSALIAVAGVAASVSFGVSANALALMGGVVAATIAWRFPRATLQFGFSVAGAAIIAAPLIMGGLLSLIPPGFVDMLPLSWAMRIEIWQFAMERIAEAPITGHGLDASRVLGEPDVLRGVAFDRLPLHAHNAGLTIWLETGAVGAILFGGMLIAVGQTLSRRMLLPVQGAAIAYACTTFFVTVQVGSGVWQEWLHAALAFALIVPALIRRETGADIA